MSRLQVFSPLTGERLEAVRQFLAAQDIAMGDDADCTALLYDEERLLAAGSLCGAVLKYIAVSPDAQGEGACAKIVSALIGEAYQRGHTHLFLYTKPERAAQFRSLGFYDVIVTDSIAMLESRRNGLGTYLSKLKQGSGLQGACVMNCAPFTLGHRYLVEEAAKQVDTLHLFIVSEEGGAFSAAFRKRAVAAGVADIPNIILQDCGSYLVSAATFPTYFIKERAAAESAQADLDIALFARRIAPALSITRRFVGTEPYCPVTARYNQRLAEELPRQGIELIELPRKDGISASEVRRAMAAGDWERVRQLVPQSTYDLLRDHP